MVDDFQIIVGKRSIHVCNAPSPAATASIEIGKEVVRRIPVQAKLIESVI
jgi:L-2-hydroxyglutarate oxidase